VEDPRGAQSNNEFIKEKVIGLIYRLLEKNILTKDIFVNKIGAKNSVFVMDKLVKQLIGRSFDDPVQNSFRTGRMLGMISKSKLYYTYGSNLCH